MSTIQTRPLAQTRTTIPSPLLDPDLIGRWPCPELGPLREQHLEALDAVRVALEDVGVVERRQEDDDARRAEVLRRHFRGEDVEVPPAVDAMQRFVELEVAWEAVTEALVDVAALIPEVEAAIRRVHAEPRDPLEEVTVVDRSQDERRRQATATARRIAVQPNAVAELPTQPYRRVTPTR